VTAPTAQGRAIWPQATRTEGVTPRYRVTHGWSAYTDHEHLVDALAQMVDLLRQPTTSTLLAQVGLIDLEVRAGDSLTYHPTLVEADREVVRPA
jgi:hypothetical protein